MRWLKILGWAFVAYTVLGIWSIGESVIDRVSMHEAINWGSLLVGRALEEYTCATAAPVLFWVSAKFPIDRQTWTRHAPILLASAFGLAVAKYIVYFPLFFPFWSHYWHDGWAQVPYNIVYNALQVTTDFVSVIVVAHAIQYYERSRERERTEAALRVRLSQAQLEALKSQLHPHFLFNTLNSVASLMHWDVAAADEMVTQLSELLRETLQHPGTHEITLADELALIERYLAIVRVRFQDRLTVTYDIEPGVTSALVPHFLLQPLVENALEHGIALEPGPGCVGISAARDGDRVRIVVRDDGPGLDPAVATNGNGVGLANTRARLVELYGDKQRLILEPAAPRGARAIVELPYHT
jgi:two-component system, LytTR family, sensor kinase